MFTNFMFLYRLRLQRKLTKFNYIVKYDENNINFVFNYSNLHVNVSLFLIYNQIFTLKFFSM